MACVKDQKFEILARAQLEHESLRQQQIVDAKAAVEAIMRVCQEVEIISERQITNLWVSLGSPFRLFSSEGMAIISGGRVNKKHILQAIATARAVPLPDQQEVVHILPRYFKVDRKDPVFNPIGLSGLRLETSVLLAACEIAAIQDLRRCLKDAGRGARGFVIQPLAGSLSVISEEDKNYGVCVVDIGKNSTQAALFSKGRVVSMFQIPFGGEDITGDIVNYFRLSPIQAEQMKIKYGIPPKESLSQSVVFEGAEIKMKQIYDVTTRSLESSFSSFKKELKSKGLMDLIYNGIVLTGGSARLKNISGWAANYFEKPAKVGHLLDTPQTFSGNLELCGALGLIRYAKDDRLDFKEKSNKRGGATALRNWLKDLMA